MTINLRENERLDELQRNGYQIIQNTDKFCFGMDAVLLSNFAKARKEDKVLDLGTGTGIIPILMEAKTSAYQFKALEIQEESADMARRSVSINKLEEKVSIITGDIKKAVELFGRSSYEVVVSNPPYMNQSHGIINPDSPKAIARHEVLCSLEDVISNASGVLKPNGRLYMVHRPFRLVDIIHLCVRYQLEPKRMMLVHPYVDREPTMVLIEAVKGGNRRMKVEEPLIIYSEPGVYSDKVRNVYGAF